MVSGEIELIADSLLIQKLANIDYGIRKQAGWADIISGSLGEGASSISNFVQNQVGTSGQSPVETIENVIGTGALWKIWWPLGLLNSITSQLFGFNIVTVAEWIWNKVKSALSDGPILPSVVTSAALEAANHFSGMTSSSSRDLFEIIRTADAQGELVGIIKSAAGAEEGFFGFLKNLKSKKAIDIIVGLVGWAIRCSLMGAGLLSGVGMAAKLLGIKHEAPSSTDHGHETNSAEYTTQPELGGHDHYHQVKLTATGRGEDFHKNDHTTSTWVVPLVGGSIERTLLVWAGDVYRELNGIDQLITSTASFNKTVGDMREFFESGSSELVVPSKYQTRKQVVDQFAIEVASKIGN